MHKNHCPLQVVVYTDATGIGGAISLGHLVANAPRAMNEGIAKTIASDQADF